MKRFLLLFMLLPGCAAMQAQTARDQMQAKYDGLMGRTQDEIIEVLGAPVNVQNLGSMTILSFYQSYGSRAQAYTYPGGYSSYAQGRSWEAYDKADIVIRDNVAVSWTGYVQR